METARVPLRVVPPAGSKDDPGPLNLTQAYRLYSRYVAAIAIRLIGRDDEVDDVVQDVFLRAHRGAGGVAGARCGQGVARHGHGSCRPSQAALAARWDACWD